MLNINFIKKDINIFEKSNKKNIMYKIAYFLIFTLFMINSCSPVINKSGVADTKKFSNSFEGLNKNEIINLLGKPSSINTLDNSFIYYSEVKKEKNIFNNKVISRNTYVIKFDKNNNYIDIKHYQNDDYNKIKISKKTTDNRILKTGFIERVFGGVGKRTTLPGIPDANVGQ